MRPYLVCVASVAAALVASIETAGVSAAFVGGRGPSMAFHSGPVSFHRAAPRPQMAPLAGQRILGQREWGRDDGRLWRWRSRGFAGAWPVGGAWAYGPYGYGYDPYAYGYGSDPYSFGYGYNSFTYGWYDPSHGYGWDPFTHGNGYGYGPYSQGYGYGNGYDESSYAAPAPAYNVSGPSYPRSDYAVYSYRLAPSAKIIHLTPRE
jgi:hypothetical protein